MTPVIILFSILLSLQYQIFVTSFQVNCLKSALVHNQQLKCRNWQNSNIHFERRSRSLQETEYLLQRIINDDSKEKSLSKAMTLLVGCHASSPTLWLWWKAFTAVGAATNTKSLKIMISQTVKSLEKDGSRTAIEIIDYVLKSPELILQSDSLTINIFSQLAFKAQNISAINILLSYIYDGKIALDSYGYSIYLNQLGLIGRFDECKDLFRIYLEGLKSNRIHMSSVVFNTFLKLLIKRDSTKEIEVLYNFMLSEKSAIDDFTLGTLLSYYSAKKVRCFQPLQLSYILITA